jgi:hypothetical protein
MAAGWGYFDATLGIRVLAFMSGSPSVRRHRAAAGLYTHLNKPTEKLFPPEGSGLASIIGSRRYTLLMFNIGQ